MRISLKYLFSIIIFIYLSFFKPLLCRAIYDPLVVNNNKIGIHILDPNEIEKVPDLVNSSGGDWGYVTVPLRTDDRNRQKWLKFFNNCRQKHLIPIVRLATIMNSHGWQKPNLYDSLDAANFLNDMPWPVQNRYIIVYNEPNHGQEWGGAVDPSDYGRVLKHTSLIFKKRNPDFFILSAGLDAAAPSQLPYHEELYSFIAKMQLVYPDIFDYLNGWTSHSYPNPGFSGLPTDSHKASIRSFIHELNFIQRYTSKKLPIFITETGWDQERLGEKKTADFFQYAFDNVWDDGRVVAVTPFLLMAGSGDFKKFSFLKPDGSKNSLYHVINNISKTAGKPKFVSNTVFAQVLGANIKKTKMPVLEKLKPGKRINLSIEKWKKIFYWIMLY